MQRLARAVVLLRRMILAALVLLLAPHYIQKAVNDGGRGINDPIAMVEGDGAVTKITVGTSFPIDADTFTADYVYVTPKQILVAYTFRSHQKKNVWSFPEMSLKLVTPDGQELPSRNGGSHGTPWGERGYVSYELPNKPADRAALVYDLYDRYGRLDIPLAKAGDGA